MIDRNLLRTAPDTVRVAIARKEPLFPLDQLIALDVHVRDLQHQLEQLQQERNSIAQQGKSGVTDTVRAEGARVGHEISKVHELYTQAEQAFNDVYLRCPNIPDNSIPDGGKESNTVIKSWGEKPIFEYPIRNHVELGNKLGWFDFEAAARMTKGNFALYRGDAVRLTYALTMLMLENNQEYGYSPVLPPYVVNEQALIVASNFPKFKDQVFALTDNKLFLTPTAEVNIASMWREHTFGDGDLPIRLTAWTSCFRQEAGTYGAHERGLIRIHEFEKVELYTLCEPELVAQEHERMLAAAENILQKLGLHYRVSLLAAQDCSFASAKTYDIEVWMPGQNAYYEVSSCSNCTDFQARRGQLKYKKTGDKKSRFVYTLNGSSLAIPRLIVALMETYQQPDGSIKLPDILYNYGCWGKSRAHG